MQYKFYTDPETNEPHIFNHGVTEDEAIESIENKAEIKRSRKDSFVAIGRTAAGRTLKVVYVKKIDYLLIVTGYEMSGRELKAFRRRCGK